MSSDNVLYCHHDLTMDRTTTLEVRPGVSVRPISTREGSRCRGSARVGRAADMPAIPRLSAVLEAIGPHAVLCIEPKDDSAYPQADLRDRECRLEGLRDDQARLVEPSGSTWPTEAGTPCSLTWGTKQLPPGQRSRRSARRLDPDRDALVIPAYGDGGLFSAAITQRAVGTGCLGVGFPTPPPLGGRPVQPARGRRICVPHDRLPDQRRARAQPGRLGLGRALVRRAHPLPLQRSLRPLVGGRRSDRARSRRLPEPGSVVPDQGGDLPHLLRRHLRPATRGPVAASVDRVRPHR